MDKAQELFWTILIKMQANPEFFCQVWDNTMGTASIYTEMTKTALFAHRTLPQILILHFFFPANFSAEKLNHKKCFAWIIEHSDYKHEN